MSRLGVARRPTIALIAVLLLLSACSEPKVEADTRHQIETMPCKELGAWRGVAESNGDSDESAAAAAREINEELGKRCHFTDGSWREGKADS
jgi:hypothetical protein